jgi:type II secretory pathway pseudopilin PulG
MLVTATLVMASIVGYSQVAKQLIQEVRLAAVAYRAKIQTYVNAANDGE